MKTSPAKEVVEAIRKTLLEQFDNRMTDSREMKGVISHAMILFDISYSDVSHYFFFSPNEVEVNRWFNTDMHYPLLRFALLGILLKRCEEVLEKQ